MKNIFKRVMLKLSGEALLGNEKFGINSAALISISREIKEVAGSGCQLAIVIGGGNIFRGITRDEQVIEEITGDYMGMLATVINALALKDSLESSGIPAKVQSAVGISGFVEDYSTKKALKYLKDGYTIVLAGGTGNPYFTTDTTAALRASELKANLILKATQVNGVYDDDPKKNPKARRYKSLNFKEAMKKKLKIMDKHLITFKIS